MVSNTIKCGFKSHPGHFSTCMDAACPVCRWSPQRCPHVRRPGPAPRALVACRGAEPQSGRQADGGVSRHSSRVARRSSRLGVSHRSKNHLLQVPRRPVATDECVRVNACGRSAPSCLTTRSAASLRRVATRSAPTPNTGLPTSSTRTRGHHDRPIVLEPWQRALVSADPRPFLRGLFHSDGGRITNWTVRPVGGEPKRYEYPRYFDLTTRRATDLR